MVYCAKCGTKNEDDALVCTNCGASLKSAPRVESNWEGRLEQGAERLGENAERFGKRMESECFGLPQGNSIIGIIFGLIVILLGVRELYDWNIDLGPYIIIIVGILIAAGALYGRNKPRRR